MKLESTLSRPATTLDSPSLHQRVVMSALAGMPRGHLTMLLPDGQQVHFGDPQGTSWMADVAAPMARELRDMAVVHVHDARFFRRCVLQGDIGFAEAYIDGDWSTPDITAVIAWFLLNIDHAPTLSGSRAGQAGLNLLRWCDRLVHLMRPNSRATAVRNIREHYDLSNEFFALWLDPTMMYSAGLWRDGAVTLEESQHAKNDALCQKLRLRPEDHVLEIGTGWGGWALHAAQRYGCRVTTLTLSKRQYDFAVERVAAAGLADRIEVRLQDYRDLPAGEVYDKLVSIEMLEAVGHRYQKDWCRVAARALKPDGLMALQFITCPDDRYDAFRSGVDFIQKHVFPGSLLISLNRINNLLSGAGGFVLNAVDDMGQDYARTLRVWRENFARSETGVRGLGFDARFMRKWNYYLSYCEAAFAMRNISVVQTVHTRPNNLAF